MDSNIFILRSQVARDNPGQMQGKALICTILTTEANERMPVILDQSADALWLDPRC